MCANKKLSTRRCKILWQAAVLTFKVSSVTVAAKKCISAGEKSFYIL